MSYGTVDRNNGDTFREQDVDQFQANDDYLRNEAGYKPIATIVGATMVDSPLSVNIDGGSEIHGGSDQQTTTNIDISSYSDGLHWLEISSSNLRVYFVKTPDANYLSAWSSASGLYLRYLTVIAHRGVQSW